MVTQPDDVTADVVIGELNRRDVSVMRFDSADFPNALTVSAHINASGLHGRLTTPSRVTDLSAVRSLYYRRPRGFTFPGLAEQEARFASLQARYGLGGVLASLPDCLYVNHPHAIADCEYKPAQLVAAAELGFDVPPTLITNDPDEASAFATEYGRIIHKPLRDSRFYLDGEPQTLWATPVEADDIDDGVSGTAHLLQARVDKVADLRLTIIAKQVFCVHLDSGGLLDWRYDYDAISYTTMDPPPDLASLCLAFCERFGLVFGCFDFALRNDGEAVFLECNANGQWLWLEEHTELPMTATLADLLERGSP